MKYIFPVPVACVLTVAASLYSVQTYCQANSDTVTYYSNTEIDSFLINTSASSRLIAKLLGRSADGEGYLVGARTQPGDVEIHEQFDDVVIIRSGHGVLRTGQKVKGQKVSGETGAREWLGGVIEDASERNLSPGDFIVVPAMLAHQYIPSPGETLTYWLIKVRRPKTSKH